MPRVAHRPTATAVAGVRVGHAESEDGSTGVTAVLLDPSGLTVVDVRGGASGTFDTASLSLGATFGRRLGLFFSGGSLFGLDAARGLRRRILETGGGVRAFDNPNPIVPISGAILFDLPRTAGPIADYEELGYRAAHRARRTGVPSGRVGAGAGASVGKYLGRARADRGGVGSTAGTVAGIGTVGVVAVVNSVGAVRDPRTARWVAGPRDGHGAVIPPPATTGRAAPRSEAHGTTLVAVMTDAQVERNVLQRIAIFAHDGLARTVEPAHTATDGDVVFVASTGRAERPSAEAFPGEVADRLGTMASDLVRDAILRAVA